jgi:hypothetical protein
MTSMDQKQKPVIMKMSVDVTGSAGTSPCPTVIGLLATNFHWRLVVQYIFSAVVFNGYRTMASKVLVEEVQVRVDDEVAEHRCELPWI